MPQVLLCIKGVSIKTNKLVTNMTGKKMHTLKCGPLGLASGRFCAKSMMRVFNVVFLFLAFIFWNTSIIAQEAFPSQFSYTIGGSLNTSLRGKPIGIRGLKGRRRLLGQCVVTILLHNPETRTGLTFMAILKNGFRKGNYPIGKSSPFSAGLEDERKNPGKIFAGLATFFGVKDGFQDVFKGQTGFLFVDHVDEGGIRGRFDLTLEDSSYPKHRRITIKGSFSHPFKRGRPGSSDNYQCSGGTMYLSDFPDWVFKSSEKDNNAACIQVKERLKYMRIVFGEYKRTDLLETALRNRLPAASLEVAEDGTLSPSYGLLVKRQICDRYNEIRTQEGRELLSCNKWIKDPDKNAAMRTDISTGKIVSKRRRPRYDPAGKAIWDAEFAHEKIHQESSHRDDPRKFKQWSDDMVHDPKARRKDEIEAYPAGIKFLEDWLKKNRCPLSGR